MSRISSKVLALAVLAGAAASTASATPQESVTYNGVITNGPNGNAVNQIRTHAFAGGYAVGKIRLSGDLTELNLGTFAGEANILVTPPSGPSFVLDPFGAQGNFTGTVSVVDFVYTLPTPLADGAGTWTFRFFESFDDGGIASDDAVWDAITFTLDDEVPPPPPPPASEGLGAVTVIPATALTDSTTLGAGEVKWYSFTLSQAVDAAGFLDIDTVGSPIDTEVGLYTATGALLANDDDGGPGLQSLLSFGSGSGNNGSAGLNGNLAAGTYYVAVAQYNTTFGASGWTVTSTGAGGDATLNITTGSVVPPTPPAAEALGALPNGTTTRTDVAHAPGQIHWYSFSIGEGVDAGAGTYLDITTVGSVLTAWDGAGTFIDDTEIGLYTDSGAIVDFDDDDGEGYTSLLSYGTGIVGTGQDGLTLPAGTYYLAVGGFNTDFAPGWSVTSTGLGEGTISLQIATNLGPAGCPADFNSDGFLDFFDYDDYVNCFETGTCPPGKTGDFNNDGFADFFDYDDFVGAFEAGC